VRIFGEEFQVGATVEVLPGFSGHADKKGLLDFVRVMAKKPQRTFIVHGEDEASNSLAEALRTELGLKQVVIPDALQSFEI
jgi:metallo-beta-lactamase family protein